MVDANGAEARGGLQGRPPVGVDGQPLRGWEDFSRRCASTWPALMLTVSRHAAVN